MQKRKLVIQLLISAMVSTLILLLFPLTASFKIYATIFIIFFILINIGIDFFYLYFSNNEFSKKQFIEVSKRFEDNNLIRIFPINAKAYKNFIVNDLGKYVTFYGRQSLLNRKKITIFVVLDGVDKMLLVETISKKKFMKFYKF